MQRLFLVMTMCLALCGALSADVYVGYADGLRGGADFPDPFAVGGTFMVGSNAYTVTLFAGDNTTEDSGAVMLINNSGSDMTINGLTVNDRANGFVYTLWGSFLGAGYTLHPNEAAIFAQTAGENFDTSDFGGNTHATSYAGFDPTTNNCSNGPIAAEASCVNNSPIVTFTIGGTPTDLFDTGHVLDTGGYDSAGYNHLHTGGGGVPQFNTNESLQWRLIGTTGIGNPGGGGVPEPSSITLLGGALLGSFAMLRRKIRKQS